MISTMFTLYGIMGKEEDALALSQTVGKHAVTLDNRFLNQLLVKHLKAGWFDLKICPTPMNARERVQEICAKFVHKEFVLGGLHNKLTCLMCNFYLMWHVCGNFPAHP